MKVNYASFFPINYRGGVLEWDIEAPAAAAAAAVQGDVLCLRKCDSQCAAESCRESARLTRSFSLLNKALKRQ